MLGSRVFTQFANAMHIFFLVHVACTTLITHNNVPLVGGPQVRFPPVFFGIEKTNGLKFHVTRCFDSRESKSLFTSPPSQWCSTLPPPLHALSPPCAEESIDLSTLEHAASPGECSNVGQFFYFVLLASHHRANHNAR